MKRVKQVVIDNKKGVVEVDGKKVPRLLLGIIRGGVGKCFVVKHYRGKKKGKRLVVTRYPDMSGVVASEKQIVRRNLFREAVVYARWIVGDEERKKAFRKTLPRKRRKHVYQAAIRLYMSMQGDAQWLRKQLAVKSMLRSGEKEMIGVKDIVRGGQVECSEKVMVRITHFEWGEKAGLQSRQGEGLLGLNGMGKVLFQENYPDEGLCVSARN